MPEEPDEPPATAPISRRRALELGADAIAAVLAASCRVGGQSEPRAEPGRLLARPGRPTGTVASGLAPLGLAAGRDGLLYVPAGYRADEPAPLVLMLHGAGGTARGAVARFLPHADAGRLILLAPESRDRTWDFIRGPYGPDVAFIDRALADVFRRCAVDAARVAIEGFSDGASYSLSLGLTNGDLFSRVIAFSPGVMAPAATHGRPRLFVTHGTQDQVLPIDSSSRRIVSELRRAGYDVDYREFEGAHTVPPELARAAVEWLTTS